MKKIFIPVISLLLTGLTTPAHAQYVEPMYNSGCNPAYGCPEEEPPLFEDIFDKPGNESYWKNRFRTYRVYPIVVYPSAPCDETGIDSQQTINAHEYQRNVVVSANKGQRMYDSTTYTLTTHTMTGEAYRVNTKGIISGRNQDFKLHTDDLLRPFGEVTINDEPYMLISLNNSANMALVDSKGKFYERLGIAHNNRLYVGNDPVIYSPQYLKVVPAQNMSQSASETKLNFDIRYNGVENNMLSFLVYNADTGTTAKRLASPAQRFININGVDFEIIYYTPEYIEYRIN